MNGQISKKIITFGIFTFFFLLTLKAQDTIRLQHKNYTTVFSKSKHYPVLVEWWVTKNKINCVNPLERKDQFKPDPLLPNETNLTKDYIGSNLDRGHMCPAAENLCTGDTALFECFYFSNMSPQYHSLNAGNWKSLETLERNLSLENDSVHVWCGNIGESMKIGTTSVPIKCWKVIYVPKTKQWLAYIFDNNSERPNGLYVNKTTIQKITKLTGFKFK